MNGGLFVTGTDTNVGKTVLSALLVAALDGVYWKPIQTGSTEGTDREAVQRWAELPEGRLLPEAYCFEPPVSPHLAARAADVRIDLASIGRPAMSLAGPLIVEGAGGALVPINETEFMLDLMRRLGLPVVVAARTSLGTINHTLLTLRALSSAGLAVKGVVMIGEANEDNRQAVEHYGHVKVLGRVPRLETINRRTLLESFNAHFDRKAFF